MKLSVFVALCVWFIDGHSEGTRTTKLPSTVDPGRREVCTESRKQSPIHIKTSMLLYNYTNNQNLRLSSVASFGDPNLNLSVRQSYILGLPDTLVYIDGDRMEGNYDLHSIKLFPRKLHTVDGMDTPKLEFHLRFIKNMPIPGKRGKYTDEFLVTAARNNMLLTLVQLVTEMYAHEEYQDKNVEEFVYCALGLAYSPTVACRTPLSQMVDLRHGLYMYYGSLVYPTCEESVMYFIVDQPVKMSGEHIRQIRAMVPEFVNWTQQPLNGRWVTLYLPPSPAAVSLPSPLWVALSGAVVLNVRLLPSYK